MLFTIGVSAIAWMSAEYWRVNKYFIHREWRQYKRELYEKLGLPDPNPPLSRGRIQPADRSAFSLSRGGLLDGLTPAQRLMLPIIAVCSGVYGLWNFPIFGLRWMYKNFAHIPDSGISRTLLTSAFSHATLMHLAFNMLALWSFSEAAYPLLGPEYYLATVASGAVVASMAQHVYGTVTHSNPALGASGFVFSIVTYVALSYPNNQALLFFVIPAPLLGLLQGLVVFDLVGLTGIWGRLFNFRLAHAAHLGGVTLGAAVWWLNQRDNRRRLANALPEEAVGLYNKSYDALIRRSR
jgi:rhomboid-like protein